jgi:hypothetical protein
MSLVVAQRFMNALNEIERSGETENLIGMFSTDCDLNSVAHSQPLTGFECAARFWREYLDAFQEIRSEFTHTTCDGNVAVLEWTSTGTSKIGIPVRYRGVSILELADDLVRRFSTYFDTSNAIGQHKLAA